MKYTTLLVIVFLLPLYCLSQTDLQVDGNVQLNRNRSTIFFQGDYVSGHRGGIQFLTNNNGATFIFQPTTATGIPVNSTLRFGGFGSFTSNTVNLAVSGNVGIGNANAQAPLDVSGSLVLRNMNNTGLAGSSIHFTSLDYNNPGPIIKSVLYYAQNADSRSALVLSSYREGYKNEMYLYNGRVGIGTSSPDATLTIKGDVHAEEVRVDLNVPGADYVFEKNYDLLPLAEVENYINENKHLPEVPAAKEMEANGINLGEMNMLLLKKVEELTLYMIELKKENEAQRQQNEIQQNEIDSLKNKLK